MNSIIRLRGEAPPLVWPRAITPIIRGLAELCEHRAPKERGALRKWQQAVDEARSEAAALFASAQGWRVRDSFPYGRLLRKREERSIPAWADMGVFDHPTFYSEPYGDIAMVIQPYRSVSHEEIPEQITVDLLPESWWWPFSVKDWPQGLDTTAYVLRPPPKSRK